MVVCLHPEEKRRYFIADIDDGRLIDGRIRWDLYRGGFSTSLRPTNKLGSRIRIPFECGSSSCALNASLQETSLPELLDKIGPHRNLFPVEDVPIYQPPTPDQIEELFSSGLEPGPGVVVGNERRHVIRLSEWCNFVGALRDRGRR